MNYVASELWGLHVRSIESGLLGERVPFIRGGAGEREAVVFSGVNALFRRPSQIRNPGRYAKQVLRLLPAGYKCTILGYPDGTSGFAGLAGEMAGVIQRPPDVLVGISLGGMVAMRFAAGHPELVKRLILLTSAHRFSECGARMLEQQFEALRRGDLRSLLLENALLFRRPWYNWLVRFKLSTMDERRFAIDFREPAAILRDYGQLFHGSDLQENAAYCKQIASPALVVGGTADQLFARAAIEETAELIPGARIRLFEKETHMLPIERHRAVAGAIARFLGV